MKLTVRSSSAMQMKQEGTSNEVIRQSVMVIVVQYYALNIGGNRMLFDEKCQGMKGILVPTLDL